MLYRISASWARIEMGCAALLALAVTVLILLNVVTRSLGAALFWVDELAIYAMVWMALLGASAAFHHRSSVSITLLIDCLPPHAKAMVLKLVDLVIFGFAVAMVTFCWRWFSPVELALQGFDTIAFQGSTFNFIYAEPTSTLGLPKYIFWLVMCFFGLGAMLHSTAHLLARPTLQDNE